MIGPRRTGKTPRARRTHGTDVARRPEPQGPGGAGGRAPPGDGQVRAAPRRGGPPPRPDVAAGRGVRGPRRHRRPDRRPRRRALRGERPRQAPGVGERDRRPGEGALSSDVPNPRGTVGLVGLGCPKNLVDGEVMLGRLQQAGYSLVSDAAAADVLVVNTCAFIDRAKQESVDTILEMARLKETGKAKRLVVTGCLSQ